MGKFQPVSFDEKKALQLEMLKEIDSFCQANNIRYSLAFGTLLGAIRHKGFIPWDDDVDIMMPLPDLLRFKNLFESKTMKIIDVKTDDCHDYAFPRIVSTKTFNKSGLLKHTHGICIDLYVLVSLPDDLKQQELYFSKAQRYETLTTFIHIWRSRAYRYLPILFFPSQRWLFKRFERHMLGDALHYGASGKYYAIAGLISLRNTMIYDFDLFESLVDVEFEGFTFKSIAAYDNYLTLRYGDYMTPPPEEFRICYHGGNYFWKK